MNLLFGLKQTHNIYPTEISYVRLSLNKILLIFFFFCINLIKIIIVIKKLNMEVKFSKYDPPEYLTSEAEINAYLKEAIEIGGLDLISVILNDIENIRQNNSRHPQLYNTI